MCDGCAVRAECLAYALSMPQGEALGVWDGTPERERRRLRDEAW